MKRAMSENNVKLISEKRNSKFRKFFNPAIEDDIESVSNTEGEGELSSHILCLANINQRPTLKSNQHHKIKLEKEEITEEESEKAKECDQRQKKNRKRSKAPTKKFFSTMQTNSCVDIDTIDGKASVLILLINSYLNRLL